MDASTTYFLPYMKETGMFLLLIFLVWIMLDIYLALIPRQ
uniref:Uncharacterized protein n=1 Tax=Rhizophora mucronata TaxID=61149 RepID=A0A2P2LDS6_RHIMU